jgi:hypothetical protein
VKPAATFCIFAAPGHKIFGDARFFSRCFSVQYFLNNRLLDSNFPLLHPPPRSRGGGKRWGSETFVMKRPVVRFLWLRLPR